MCQAVVRQESDGEAFGDVLCLVLARGESTSDDYHDSFMKKTAFSMCKLILMPTMKESFYNQTGTKRLQNNTKTAS